MTDQLFLRIKEEEKSNNSYAAIHGGKLCNRANCQAIFDPLTHDAEPGPPVDGRRAGRHHALVHALVCQLRELHLQLPVVGLLVEHLVAGVVAVRRHPVGQEVGGVAVTLQPGDLGKRRKGRFNENGSYVQNNL